MPLGAQVLTDLQLHERLTQHPHPLAQKIGIPLQLRLAQQVLKRHPQLVGHRARLLSSDVAIR
jgi:hypothetical protein